MKSVNKTNDLWNKDIGLKSIKKSRWVPLCCWFWCWWVMNKE